MQQINFFNLIVFGITTISLFYLYTEGRAYMNYATTERLGSPNKDRVFLAILSVASVFGIFSNETLPIWVKIISVIWTAHFLEISVAAHQWNALHQRPNIKSKLTNLFKKLQTAFHFLTHKITK